VVETWLVTAELSVVGVLVLERVLEHCALSPAVVVFGFLGLGFSTVNGLLVGTSCVLQHLSV
jgi:hypothetical protein